MHRQGCYRGSLLNFKIIEILLVEDNPGDVELTQEALQESKIRNKLYVARDGVEAMNFLRKKGDHKGVSTPDLVLLDLNLPRKDGREVLKELKDDPVLKSIPVVVLTSSDADKDIATCYTNHVNCYIRKPVDFDRFIEVVQQIDNFWFSIVKLPTRA